MSIKVQENEIIVYSPLTGEEVGRVSSSSSEYVEDCINQSQGYKEWSSLPLAKRCKWINKFRKIILKNGDEIQKVLKSETGKKDFDVFIEFFTVLEHFKGMPKIAKKSLKPQRRNSGLMKNKKSWVYYEPLGVAGIISPWNYPLATPIISTMEALLAGNNIVLKPSEHTPLTPLLVKKLWDEHIGYNSAFQIVNGEGNVGRMLVESKGTDVICFTGSTAVGKRIARECGAVLKPVVLELGGKDPMIVLKDANLNRAIESAIFGGLSNSGQTCISTEEVFVENPVFDEFVSGISDKVKNMSSGDSIKEELGPMIVDENRDKVNEHIREVDGKCNIVNGGVSDTNRFIAPTLLIDPPDDSRVVNEETFGPVISIRPFNNTDDLMDKVHRTGYGLSSSVFGQNKKNIENIVSRIKTGNVSVNDVLTHYGIPSLPFGGEGFSGLGRTHGPEGLIALCRIKSVVINRFNFINEPWWYGRSEFVEGLLKKVTKLIYR